MSFTPLGDALKNKIDKNLPLKKQTEAAAIVEIAQNVIVNILGKEQAKLVKPLFLKNRTLTVTCAGSAIAQEIRLHQREIADKINEKFGKKEVDRIRYLL